MPTLNSNEQCLTMSKWYPTAHAELCRCGYVGYKMNECQTGVPEHVEFNPIIFAHSVTVVKNSIQSVYYIESRLSSVEFGFLNFNTMCHTVSVEIVD